MTQFRARPAEQRRAEIQAEATALGIDDALISALVDTFYGRIQQHPELGPIFNGVIGDAWPKHLGRMKDFWSSVTMSTGRYSGKPVPKHMKLEGVTKDHFQMWLQLFEATVRELAPTPQTVPYFMEKAERIAQSLQFAMFGLPSLNKAIMEESANLKK